MTCNNFPQTSTEQKLLTTPAHLTDVSFLHTGMWMSLGNKACSIPLWGDKTAMSVKKKRIALQSHSETLSCTLPVVAVILPNKVSCDGVGWIGPTLAAGNCAVAPGFLCCKAERSDAAAGSSYRLAIYMLSPEYMPC